jgi:phosphopantothenoylcysteine decarboxylase/phosphopantothenate--cysteine ligase
VTGSIAAYKAVELASKLTQAGARVDVVMTEAATEFVTPLTFRSITHRWVITGMFDAPSEPDIEHVALAERADVVVIAPATANVIAKLAVGIADDMLCCTALATRAPIIVAPAMNVNMYENPITQDNLAKLRGRGVTIVDPGYGFLACGDTGAGRLAEVDQIFSTIQQVLGRSGDLAGNCVIVTAGGTQEPIDPVRYIGNRSTGKMGYALAEAARDRGARVILITAPAVLPTPVGMEVVQVQTALQMQEAVLEAAPQTDALIMAAAVADYRPETTAETKIKKGANPRLPLELISNPDILSEVEAGLIKVGFAAESENLAQNAAAKLKDKHLDLIVANDITAADSGFGADTNKVVLIDNQGSMEDLPLLPKSEVAHRVLNKVVELLTKRGDQETVEIKLTLTEIEHYQRIDIPRDKRNLFPEDKHRFIIETDIGEVDEAYVHPGHPPSDKDHIHGGRKLKNWFRHHRGLKSGDKLIVRVIKPMKRYRLKIA